MKPKKSVRGSTAATRRCAIYTRKSSEEGLEQSFNSLHAQREACEAYICSQAGEGWILLPQAYDDGGFSGGNMERPALRQLMADVEAGKIDVIVVYKVDRLTRSLMDFARIVERLDEKNVSFVSVTQAFNTTSSMGRLTLNVLLSFAQFEREVTGERIRDKIAASKARGMWMGGGVPLGYDLHERKLLVNEAEAEQVRDIYARYLRLASVPALARELDRDGVRSKSRTTQGGRQIGGRKVVCGALYHMLQNRLYTGEIAHRGEIFAGEHHAIVDRDLFDLVQTKLAGNRRSHAARPVRAASCPLTGIIHDTEGVPMSPSFGYGRGKKIYRYYVSASVLPGRSYTPGRPDILRRVPAAPIEAMIIERIARLVQRGAPLDWSEAAHILKRVEIRERSVHFLLDVTASLEPHEAPDAATARLQGRMEIGDAIILEAAHTFRLICDLTPLLRGGRSWSRKAEGGSIAAARSSDPALLTCLKTSHAALEKHNASPLHPDHHVHAQAAIDQRGRRMMNLGLLAPDLQRAILENRAPAGLTANKILSMDLPLGWADQRRVLESLTERQS